MSISLPLSSRAIELSLREANHHAAAELDHKPADDRGIDFHVERDVLARHRFQRSSGRRDSVAEPFGHRDVGARLALNLATSARKARITSVIARPPVAGEDFQEICGDTCNTRPVEDGDERLQLCVRRKHRAADRRLRSAPSPSRASNSSRSPLPDRWIFHRAPVFEQGRCITAGHPKRTDLQQPQARL